MSESKTIFKLRNNSVRTYGFADRLCKAGSGCPTPEAALKLNERLPGLFELTEEEMWKSWRGVLAAMKDHNSNGQAAIEVFIDGVVEPLTAAQINGWAEEARAKRELPIPKNRREHGQEIEAAMNRAPDPMEVSLAKAQEARDRRLAEIVVQSVLAAQAQQQPAKGR